MGNLQTDIVIIGSGPAGLSMAASLAGLGLKSIVLEKQPQEKIATPDDDGREIALTWRSVALLDRLGVWPRINQHPLGKIETAYVHNGTGVDGLAFAASHTDKDRLSFIVSNHLIRQALYDTVLDNPMVTTLYGSAVTGMSTTANGAVVTLDNGDQIQARLAIAADSRFSPSREMMGLKAERHDFKRTMIVARMQHELPHHHCAYEWFQDERTLAMLPLAGNHSSAVFTVPNASAKSYLAMDEQEYAALMASLFNHRYGQMTLVGKRYGYPLVAMYASRFYAPSFLLAGDAAVGMHPVTAHGFNFGLRGVEIFTRLAQAAMETGGDYAELSLLRQYHFQLRMVTRPLYLATNLIGSLYARTDPIAHTLRRGLITLGRRIPMAQDLIARRLLDGAAA